MSLKAQHRFVIEMVSIYFGLETDQVLNEVIDHKSSVEILDSLFEPGGRSAVMFYMMEGPMPELGIIIFIYKLIK